MSRKMDKIKITMANLKMKLEQAEDRCSKAELDYAKFNRQSVEVTNILISLLLL